MTKAEAYELALMQVEFAHDLGEAVNRSFEFWMSVSYVLLILAFVAAHILNRITTPLILTLYILYSMTTGVRIEYDLDTGEAAMRDAQALISEHQLSLEVFDQKNRDQYDPELKLKTEIGTLHAPGLFLVTIGYVCFASYQNWRRNKESTA